MGNKRRLVLLALAVAVWPVLCQAVTMTPFLEPESSPTWPAGSTFPFVSFVSDTADPLGFLQGQSVYFRGFLQGGSTEQRLGAHLVYRIRLDFDDPVSISQLTLTGAGDNVSAGTDAVLRLLDTTKSEISTVMLTGFNTLGTFSVGGSSLAGTTFFVDQFDYSTEWRYLASLSIDFTPVPQAVPEPSTLALLGSGVVAFAVFRRRLTAKKNMPQTHMSCFVPCGKAVGVVPASVPVRRA